MKRLLLVLCALATISCSKKPSLSSDDLEYVRTSLDLMRVRARVMPGTDSTTIKSMLDSACRRHHTSRAAYLKQTTDIGAEPQRADLIYNAINDSIGGNK